MFAEIQQKMASVKIVIFLSLLFVFNQSCVIREPKTTPQCSCNGCPKNYKAFESNPDLCFSLIIQDDLAKWEDGKELCEESGGVIASLENYDQAVEAGNELLRLIDEEAGIESVPVWIGARKIDSCGRIKEKLSTGPCSRTEGLKWIDEENNSTDLFDTLDVSIGLPRSGDGCLRLVQEASDVYCSLSPCDNPDSGYGGIEAQYGVLCTAPKAAGK